MEQTSYKPLEFRSISEAVVDAVKYIDDRRKGRVFSLKTKWPKFNRLCMGGIEPNTIYTFAGMSSSGKTALLNSLETDIIELNPKIDIVILSFNYEIKYKLLTSLNSVNCLENPEEGNQQPSLASDSFEGSTTSSESQVDNNSTTKAGQYLISINTY